MTKGQYVGPTAGVSMLPMLKNRRDTIVVNKKTERLLLPIGFGAILANIPYSAVIGTVEEPGFLKIMYNVGITTELFPILIFYLEIALILGLLLMYLNILMVG